MHICINFVPLLLCNWWRKFRIFYQHFALIFPQNSCSLPSPCLDRAWSMPPISGLRTAPFSCLESGFGATFYISTKIFTYPTSIRGKGVSDFNIINYLVSSASSYYWMCWMTWIGIQKVFSGELDLEKDSGSRVEYQD